MSYYGFAAGLIVAFLLWSAGLDWLGLVFVFIAFVVLVYPRTKKEAKKIRDDVKKTDAFYPQKKFDAYAKTAGKQAAEYLGSPKNTEIGAKNWLHKTHQIATNFFKELDELFK